MKNLLWCANHTPTEEQLESLNDMGNLMFLRNIHPSLMARLMDTPSNRKDCIILADNISELAEKHNAIIIQLGGSPLFLVMASPIIGSSRMIFAESDKISEDIPQPDGSVKKVSIFKHKGWI